MPIRIPSPQVEIQPVTNNTPQLPQKGQGAAAIASGLGQAAQVAGGVAVGERKYQKEEFDKVQQDILRKTRAANLLEIENNLSEAVRTRRAEIENKKGINAVGVTKETHEFIDKAIEDLGGTVEDDVRVLFHQRAQSQKDALLNWSSEYEAQQNNIAVSEKAEAKIVSNIDMAASAIGPAGIVNTQAISDARADIVGVVNAMADVNGWEKTEKDRRYSNALKTAFTKMHVAVIHNLADVDPEKAQKYFDDNKQEIFADAWDELTNNISSGDYRVGGQKVLDYAMQNLDSWGEREKYIVEHAKPGIQREYAVTELHQAQDRETKERAAAREANKQKGISQFAVGGFSVSAIEPGVWNQMDGDTQKSLIEAQKSPLELRVTNFGVYDEVAKLASTNPNQFLQIALPTLPVNLREYNKLTEMRDRILQGFQVGSLTVEQQLDNATARLDKTKAEDREEAGRFRSAVEDAFNDYKTKGIVLTPEQQKDIINRMGAEFAWKTPGRVASITGGLINLGDTQNKTTYAEILSNPAKRTEFVKNFKASDIAPEHVKLIEQALRAEKDPSGKAPLYPPNQPIPQQAIIQRYLLKVYGIR